MIRQPRATCYTPPAISRAVPIATLFISELLPAAIAEDDAVKARFPALERLMARSLPATRACEDDAAWFCNAFDVDIAAGAPAGPLALLGSGGEPGGHYWFRAEPVHLQVQGDKIVMATTGYLKLAPDETAPLLQSLNAHFRPDGFEFVAGDTGDWFLRAPAIPALRTVAPALAAGRDIDPLFPQGPDRLRYHRLLNEVQMVLHEHPVNQAREAAGAPVVNSVWLWGGGTLPLPHCRWHAVHAESPLLRGLCKAAGRPARVLAPDTLHATGDALIELRRDPGADWSGEVQRICTTWVAPLVEQLVRGRLEQLRIATVRNGHALEWSASRSNMRRFWKRPRSLVRLVQELGQ